MPHGLPRSLSKAAKKSASITALTDNSGGTSGGNTIAVVSDTATTKNAVATLAAKVNAIIAALKTAGIMT